MLVLFNQGKKWSLNSIQALGIFCSSGYAHFSSAAAALPTVMSARGEWQTLLATYGSFDRQPHVAAGQAFLNGKDLTRAKYLFDIYYRVPTPGEVKYLAINIQAMYVGPHPHWKSQCMWLILKDGTTDTIGCKHFRRPPHVSGEVDRSKVSVSDAFRNAIDDQVASIRRFGMEVDHVIPLCTLRDNFLAQLEQGNSYDTIGVTYEKATRTWQLADANLKRLWQQYHEKHVQLELVTRAENVRRAENICREWRTTARMKAINRTQQRGLHVLSCANRARGTFWIRVHSFDIIDCF